MEWRRLAVGFAGKFTAGLAGVRAGRRWAMRFLVLRRNQMAGRLGLTLKPITVEEPL